MKTRIVRCLFAFALTLTAIGLLPTEGQAGPPIAPKKLFVPQGPPPLVAYGGFFNQQADIETRLRMPTGDVVTPMTNFNMRALLALAWNDTKAVHQAAVRDFMTKNLRLYDVSVNIASANPNPAPNGPEKALIMYVDPNTRLLTLVLQVPGNRMSGSLSVPWNFDPSMSGTYDLEWTVFFDTMGPANAPIRYKASRIAVKNFQHGILDLAISGQATTFGQAVMLDGTAGQAAANRLNSMLTPALALSHMGIVRPGMRLVNGSFHLVFELSRPDLRALAAR